MDGDMTQTKDEKIAAPSEGDPNGDMVPVPEALAATLKAGDTVTGTVVDVGGSLQIQISPVASPEEYTGSSPEEMEMTSDEALAKYVKGNKKTQ